MAPQLERHLRGLSFSAPGTRGTSNRECLMRGDGGLAWLVHENVCQSQPAEGMPTITAIDRSELGQDALVKFDCPLGTIQGQPAGCALELQVCLGAVGP